MLAPEQNLLSPLQAVSVLRLKLDSIFAILSTRNFA